MVSADRSLIMETNRSLRNIKTELENLLEKGVIDENVFDTIHASLPPESSLSGPLRTTSNSDNPVASPAASATSHTLYNSGATSPAPPTQAFNNLSVSRQQQSTSPAPPPPTYDETPPPGPPPRNNPAPLHGKPILTHARALYRYDASDARDVTFEKDDQIAVLEYMNADWWMGRNTRTGREGIFPRNYVLVDPSADKASPYQQQQPVYGYPQPGGPPAQQNPYNSNVPPMAVAEGGQDQQGSGKAGQMGKKFGKKLGNAAIFGAGASIGSNIVNGIF